MEHLYLTAFFLDVFNLNKGICPLIHRKTKRLEEERIAILILKWASSN
jgi:hypothetical protein